MIKIDKTGKYEKALKTYGDDFEVKEALEKGREFLKLDPEQITRHLDGLSDAAKKAFRSGAARALKDAVEKVTDTGDAAKRIFGNEMIRKKIRAVMPDQKSYLSLARKLQAERQFTKTQQTILGGSQAQPQYTGQAAAERTLGHMGALGASALPGGHPLVRATIGRRIASGIAKATPERSAEMARMLFSRNQAENQRTIELLMKNYTSELGGTSRAFQQTLINAAAQMEGRYLAPEGSGKRLGGAINTATFGLLGP
jgi:hypothetical protein